MTITVDIRPEVQAELVRQAASRGSALEDYAATLLEEAVHVPAETPTSARCENAKEEKVSWKYARW